ncbi:MAG TPA: insulinase family protein [Bacteroidales bacterium]|nr:insulinase family protein [Bacteroidales bacterium]
MKKTAILVISLLWLTVMAVAQGVNYDEKLVLDPTVRTGVLDNGLTYYIKSNPTPQKRAELMLVVNAGSVLEDDDQQGLAHFVEHMAFNGTRNFPKHDLINYLESLGMKFGPEVNAGTSFDLTMYGIKVPTDSADVLDKGLLVLYDWAHQVSLEDEEIEAERGIIHEEWRMSQGAMERMQKELLKVLFHGSKYADRLPIGLMSVVDSCDHEAVRRFYKDWYRPDLQAVILVGDFDAAAMEVKVKELFGRIEKPKNPRTRPEIDIPDHDEMLVSVASDPESPYAMVYLVYKHPQQATLTVGDYRKDLITNLYNSMISKRLQELTLIENPPFAQGMSMYTSFLGPKSLYMGIGIAQNNDVIKAMDALVVENNRVKTFGFTQTELDREKASMLKDYEKMYNDRNKAKSEDLAQEYQSYYLPPHTPAPGIEKEFELAKQLLPTITLDDVNAFAKTLVTEKNAVIAVMMPEKEGVVIPTKDEMLAAYKTAMAKPVQAYVDKVSDKPLVESLPAKGKVAKKAKNKDYGYEVWTLSNGAKVVIKKTDFKDDEILFSASSWGGTSLYEQDADISGDIADGVAMESGLGDFDQTELIKYNAGKNVDFSIYVSELSEGMHGSTSVQEFETLLQMIHVAFTKPRVTESAFNSYLNKQKAMLENQMLDPQSVWSDTLQVVRSNYHPRRRPLSMGVIEEANYKMVQKIIRQRFSDANNFTFYFVGNIDMKQAKPLIEKYIGSLPAVTRNETYKDLGIKSPQGVVEKTVYKGKDDKCMVAMNFHGSMNYTYKDRLELNALCSIISTKLLEEIREKVSGVYTIGAYPQMSNRPDSKYDIIVFFSCDPARLDELTKGVFDEINKIKTNGPSDVDLKKAQEKLRREYETNQRENNYWLNKLSEFENGDLSQTEFKQFKEIVDAMSSESFKKAANFYFDEKNYVKVVLKAEK